MTLPFPEYETTDPVWPELDQDERAQVNGVAQVAMGGAAKAAVALGGAFLVYRQYMKNRLKQKLKGEEEMDPDQLTRVARGAFIDFAPVWSYMVGPSVFSSLLIGVEESGQIIPSDNLRRIAYSYAWNLGAYINQKAIDSAKRGFQAQVNRKVDRKKAKDNVVKAFGITIPGMRSLVGIWTQDEPESTTEETLTSTKPARARRVIEEDAKARAKQIGEEETFSLKSIGKQMAWVTAQQQGLIPMTATRQWITADDEKVCPECGPLHKMEVSITDPFVINEKKVWAPSLHPNCRCDVKLRANLGQQAAISVSQILNETAHTRQWTSADDSVEGIGKSDNDWETQPRGAGGQFGQRKHTMTRVALLDRPKQPTEAELDQMVADIMSTSESMKKHRLKLEAKEAEKKRKTVTATGPKVGGGPRVGVGPSAAPAPYTQNVAHLNTVNALSRADALPRAHARTQAVATTRSQAFVQQVRTNAAADPEIHSVDRVDLGTVAYGVLRPRMGKNDEEALEYGVKDENGNVDHRVNTKDMHFTTDPREVEQLKTNVKIDMAMDHLSQFTLRARGVIGEDNDDISVEADGGYYRMSDKDVNTLMVQMKAGYPDMHSFDMDTNRQLKTNIQLQFWKPGMDDWEWAPISRAEVVRQLDLPTLDKAYDEVKVATFNAIPDPEGEHGDWVKVAPNNKSGMVSDYYRIKGTRFDDGTGQPLLEMETINQDHPAREHDLG